MTTVNRISEDTFYSRVEDASDSDEDEDDSVDEVDILNIFALLIASQSLNLLLCLRYLMLPSFMYSWSLKLYLFPALAKHHSRIVKITSADFRL